MRKEEGFMNKYMWYIVLVLIIIIVLLILHIKKEKDRTKLLEDLIVNARKQISTQNCKIIELNDVIKQYGYFSTSLNIFKECKAVKIVKNKLGNLYIVMEDFRDTLSGKDLDFYLSGERCQGICSCPRILATVKNDYIWIEDLFAIDEDCGNGTLLLECLFAKAKELKIDTIKGELSPVDRKNFDKLEHFYKKNGFDVRFNQERTSGLIKRKICLEGTD